MWLYSNELVGYPCAEEGCAFQGRTWTEYQVHKKAKHRGNLVQMNVSCCDIFSFKSVISAFLRRGSAVRHLCKSFPWSLVSKEAQTIRPHGCTAYVWVPKARLSENLHHTVQPPESYCLLPWRQALVHLPSWGLWESVRHGGEKSLWGEVTDHLPGLWIFLLRFAGKSEATCCSPWSSEEKDAGKVQYEGFI